MCSNLTVQASAGAIHLDFGCQHDGRAAIPEGNVRTIDSAATCYVLPGRSTRGPSLPEWTARWRLRLGPVRDSDRPPKCFKLESRLSYAGTNRIAIRALAARKTAQWMPDFVYTKGAIVAKILAAAPGIDGPALLTRNQGWKPSSNGGIELGSARIRRFGIRRFVALHESMATRGLNDAVNL